VAGERRLVVATHNPGKVAEINELLEDSGWSVSGLPEGAPEFPETGDTFAANSRGKALFYADLTGLPALADDSGLQIDALGGEPGVYSARYIDPAIPQSQRNLEVLARLTEVPEERRGARFVCHVTLAVPGEVVHETVGTCEGRIAEAPQGEGGFGYDPIFVLPDLGVTFAQLSRQQKSSRSHRGNAVRDMVRFLRQWRGPGGGDVS
jgi:XTP/dITP diphosphohydrolase